MSAEAKTALGCDLLDLTPANQRVLLHRGRARLRGALEAAIG